MFPVPITTYQTLTHLRCHHLVNLFNQRPTAPLQQALVSAADPAASTTGQNQGANTVAICSEILQGRFLPPACCVIIQFNIYLRIEAQLR